MPKNSRNRSKPKDVMQSRRRRDTITNQRKRETDVDLKKSEIKRLNWDVKSTIKHNYNKLGLLYNLNKTHSLNPDLSNIQSYLDQCGEIEEEDKDRLILSYIEDQAIIERDEEGNIIKCKTKKDIEEYNVHDKPIIPIKAKSEQLESILF